MVWVYFDSVRMNWSLAPFLQPPGPHAMPEGDFINLWSAGHLVRLGQMKFLYSHALFQAWKQGQFGADLLVQDWIYPPTVLLIGVPLSFLPLGPAYLLWDLVTFAIAVVLLRAARLPWRIIGAGLAGPATWSSLMLGQYGPLAGGLVVAGLLLAPRYPIRAGIMLGLATVKPQQGAIVPIAWLAARSWRAIAAACVMFAVMALAVILGFGVAAWTLFFTKSSVIAKDILEASPPQPIINTGVSVFWMLRTLGSGVALAYAAQLAAALGSMVVVYRAWRKPDAEPLARMALTVCLSLLITPYGYAFDMVAYSIAVAVIVANNQWKLRLIDVVLWLWPAYSPAVTLLSGVLLTPIVISIAAAQAWTQMGRRSLYPGLPTFQAVH